MDLEDVDTTSSKETSNYEDHQKKKQKCEQPKLRFSQNCVTVIGYPMFQSTSNFPTHDACNLTNNNNTVIDRQTDRQTAT